MMAAAQRCHVVRCFARVETLEAARMSKPRQHTTRHSPTPSPSPKPSGASARCIQAPASGKADLSSNRTREPRELHGSQGDVADPAGAPECRAVARVQPSNCISSRPQGARSTAPNEGRAERRAERPQVGRCQGDRRAGAFRRATHALRGIVGEPVHQRAAVGKLSTVQPSPSWTVDHEPLRAATPPRARAAGSQVACRCIRARRWPTVVRCPAGPSPIRRPRTGCRNCTR